MWKDGAIIKVKKEETKKMERKESPKSHERDDSCWLTLFFKLNALKSSMLQNLLLPLAGDYDAHLVPGQVNVTMDFSKVDTTYPQVALLTPELCFAPINF